MIPGALRRNIASYDKGTLKKTKTVDKSSVQYQQKSAHNRHGTPEEWSALQNKIFTRWVNQKLAKRFLKIDDVTTAFKDSVNLVHLLEILSETKCDKKIEPTTVRVKQIDNANKVLDFLTHVGVKMTLSPSPENIVDGNQKIILGMLWAIMSKFLKIGDEEDLNAQDALLMWVQNQVSEYKGVLVDNLTTSFHDGLAFCALMHKFRPNLINFDALDAKNGEDNLKTALEAAEKAFGLEQYLKPSDVLKLDDKSMAVFLAEFYHGIGEERRLDVAARRIAKVIRFTVTNDAKKKEYNEKAQALKQKLEELQPQLAKLSEIDSTFAGAKRRLDEFTSYKTKHKSELMSSYLYLESLFNQISRRLSDGKRPAFVPTSGCTVKELSDTLTRTEEKEGKLQISLYDEFNRQIKLVNLNQRHLAKYEDLTKWSKEKKLYLSIKENVNSVGTATYQLNILGAYESEFKEIQVLAADLKQVGDQLAKESYEEISTIRTREETVQKSLEELTKLAATKREILEDDLSRELLAEKVRGLNKDHQTKYEKLQNFVADKKKYLQAKVEVKSVSEAKLQIALLESYESEKKSVADGNIGPFHKLGTEVRETKYETKFSIWILPDLIQVQKREMAIDAAFQELDMLSAEKLKVLKDDLAREEFREKLHRRNEEHVDKSRILEKWINEKLSYLNIREEIKSSSDAEVHLGLLVAYQKERNDTHQASVPALKTIGSEIATLEYKSPLSQYKWPRPEEVKLREGSIDKGFTELDSLHTVKHKRLVDDLKREEFRENTENLNQKHLDKSQKIQAFIAASNRYLKKKESVASIADANLNLARLRSLYFDEQKDNDVKFEDLKKLGKTIREAKYETDLSKYTFPKQQEVTEREDSIADSFKSLAELAATKKKVLEDDLAREQFREKLRQKNMAHINKHKKLLEFIVSSKVYLGKKETVYSIADAHLNLTRLHEYEEEKKLHDLKFDNCKNLGEQIKTEEYKTEFSQFSFKTPEEVVDREQTIEKEFLELVELHKKKKAVLEDDLAREEFKEKLRQWNLKHTEKTNKLLAFLHSAKTYLMTKDDVTSIAQAELNLGRFREYEDEKKVHDVKFEELKKFGSQIRAEEYKTGFSSYKYPQPEEIDRREQELADAFKELSELGNKKFDILNDDREREEFKDRLRQWDQDHLDKFNAIEAFVVASRKYLKTKEAASSIIEAQTNLDHLQAHFGDKADFDIKVKSLKTLGDKIRSAEHYTQLSSYKHPNPKEILSRENNLDVSFAELDLLSGEKDAVDEDKTEWLRKQAEKLSLILGADDDDDDDDDEDDEAVTVEVKERASRRKSVKAAVGLMTKGDYKTGGKLAILKDDLAREQFKQKLRRWNKQHIDAHKNLLNWVAESKAYLGKKEEVDSITSAQANLARFFAFITAKTDVTSVNVAALKKLGSEILDAEYKTQWSQWKWDRADEVKTREEEISSMFALLDKMSATKQAVLEDDLAREEFREKLRVAAGSHEDAYRNIKVWAAGMKVVLQRSEPVANISDANNNLAAFHAAMGDKEDARNINVATLKKKGLEITEAQYKTSLSSYVFPDPGLIKSREFEIEKEWAALDELAAKKKAVLIQALRTETKKEDLRLSFANTARNFARFVTDVVDESKEIDFGFTLPEVQKFKDVLESQEKDYSTRGGANKKESEQLHAELTSLGVTDNIYTKHTPQTLNKVDADLQTAIKIRHEAYEKELKRHLENDALCREFAQKAEAVHDRLKRTRESIISSTRNHQEQLIDVQKAAEIHKKSDELAQCKALQAKITSAGIANNPHTVLSVTDLEVAGQQFELFLTTKQEVLEKEIEHQKLRGITPQEYAQIDRQFKLFDRDSNKLLDRSEFKACLYSLGEDIGKREIQAIMDKYGGSTDVEAITYEQFKEWMIDFYGIADTKKDILHAFHMISFDEKSARITDFVPRRIPVITYEDLEFFKSVAPKTAGRSESWDYPPFVEEVFSR